MNRISRYQEGIAKFLRTKSFIDRTTPSTKKILEDLLAQSDHIPAILFLTILNSQCKKNDLKFHGYYLASGIDVMGIVATITTSREHFDQIYGADLIDNMILEVTCHFYTCLLDNIDTMRMSNRAPSIATPNSHMLVQRTVEYVTRLLPRITQKHTHRPQDKMKKTDLFCRGTGNNTSSMHMIEYKNYKKKHLLAKHLILADASNKYGTVCILALCLGWILGHGHIENVFRFKELTDDKHIGQLEHLGNTVGVFLKLYEDFKHIDRINASSPYSLNYVANYGIKDAYNELVETRIRFIEGLMVLQIDTKTSTEIMELVMGNVDERLKDISVDMETHYDDVSGCG